MIRRLFNILSAASLLLGMAAMAMWAWSPGRMFRLDRACSHVLYCNSGRMIVMHFDYFPSLRTHGDERDAWGAAAVAQIRLAAVAAISSILPALWCYIAVRSRLRTPPGRCRQCGYDLRASRDRCPECGMNIPATTQSSSQDGAA